MNEIFTILNMLILVANICLTIITVKLYTEIFKDNSARDRERSK